MTTPMITSAAPANPARLMRPAEVAALFHVDVKTVARWANSGRLPSLRTMGGHHRFRAGDVHAAPARRA